MGLETAIIGYGERGEVLANIIRKHVPELEVLMVVDPDPLRRNLANRNGLAAFENKEDLFDRRMPDVKAVVIASDPPLHCSHVLMAAKYGCHIFCEKPHALSPDESDQMVAAVHEAGVVCTIDFETIYADAFRAFEAQLHTEEFGKLIRIDATDKGRPPSYDIETCAPHYFHAVQRLIGARPIECFARVKVDGRRAGREDIVPIAELYPQGRSHDIGIRAHTIEASYEFENSDVVVRFFWAELDEQYVVDAGMSANKPGSEFMKLVAYGTRGQVKFHQTSTGSVYVKHVPEDTLAAMQWEMVYPLSNADPTWVVPTTRLIQDFVEAIKTGRDPVCNIEDAAMTVDMAYAIYASHFAGKPVKLPLEDRRHPLRT
jgi:predicted dehydrogenase